MEQVRNIISRVKRVLWVASFNRGGDGESVKNRITDEVRSGAEQSGKNTWGPNTFMGRR
jgi:hypothetical protein